MSTLDPQSPERRPVAPDERLQKPLRVAVTRALERARTSSLDAAAAGTLESITAAWANDDLALALRHVDRAWRCLPAEAAIIAPLYGQLLMLEARDYDAARVMLDRALALAPDPDLAALAAVALLRSTRLTEAVQAFEAALMAYCVEPESLLIAAGREFLDSTALAAPGWIGRGPELNWVGALASTEPQSLEVSIDGGTPYTQLLTDLGREAMPSFAFRCRHQDLGIRLHAASRGRPLLGSGGNRGAAVAVDGRVTGSANLISGWARLGWRPQAPVALRLTDAAGTHLEFATSTIARPGWCWPFKARLRGPVTPGAAYVVAAKTPEGRWQELPDSPVIVESDTRTGPPMLGAWTPATTKAARTAPRRAPAVDIVIPVYRDRDLTLACVASVLATMDADARLVVVDDASPDPELAAALDELEADGRIQLLRNATNLGFVRSANRGLRLHSRHDVILLNSDTTVFGDWLPRLRAAAYSGPRVGTVTPLTNQGSIASYPERTGLSLPTAAAAALHALAAATLAGVRIEIPVGVGFCLYLRRDCLRDVGELDAAVFGKGYGEESDFCLRARRQGWSHQLAADVYVQHAEGVSFGDRRRALLERSQRLLNQRHRGYDRFIASFLKEDPVQAARRRLDEQQLRALPGRFVLVVTLALAGGVARFVTERSAALRAKGRIPLLLRPARAGDAGRCELAVDGGHLPNLQYAVPRELGDLDAVLRSLALDGVEIQHFLHLDPRVIDLVRALPVPYDVTLHDYAWICPRVTLIDGSHGYCGEPAVATCAACVKRNGSLLGEKIAVPALRSRSATWLAGARHVTTPSADAAERLKKYFAAVAIDVRPHAGAGPSIPLPPRDASRTPLRVALLGAIGTHKGYRVLLECARDARARKLPLEFVVIGKTEADEPLLATGKVFVTGYYTEEEAPHLLRRENPDVAWLPSVWPETWCYALDYAFAAHLPVLAFDLGAIAARLRAAGTGHLLPLNTHAARINDRLLEIGGRPRAAHFTVSRARQTLVPRSADDATMATNTSDGMHMTKQSNGNPAQEAQPGLSASVQVLPLPPGLYLFSVKSVVQSAAGSNGLSLPAMHVGLGPGVRSDQVEFIAGPSTHGAWLFSASDLLVTKISAAGATLILTSVRAPGGEVLSIGVERLDARADAVTAAPALAAAAPSPARGAGKVPAPDAPEALFRAPNSDLPLPVQISAHIRKRGDMEFANVPWAGRVGQGLWIESFAVRPLDRFAAGDIEYKGLTGSGFETPWLTDNKMCGTKGMATPLVGFAIRLRPSPGAAAYDCEYSGYFQSGTTVGPLRNGAPCRSSVANDSLEGIQVRLVKRGAAAVPEVSRKGAAAHAPRPAGAGKATAKKPPAAARTGRRPATRRP